MKNNCTRPLHMLFMLFFCWTCQPVLFAFQHADGSPPQPATGEKYIFYWGRLQCDLAEANNYTGKLSCTAAAFRQMLHSTPNLWTGTGMAETITFKLDDMPVTASRGTKDYLALIGRLDKNIGQKVQAGQVVQLTELRLDAQIIGQIDIIIETAETSEPGQTYRPNPAANILNTRFLQQVIWGREDIYENTNRDFFSEAEFWQTVQQLPYLEWALYTKPQPVRVGIKLNDLSAASFGLRSDLEAPAYQEMVENLNNYRHLIQPGSVISLTLHNAEYERLFEKNMYIVAANDPRLALRRNRDTHTLKIKWGGWEEVIENLYLLELKDANGNAVVVDPPATLNRTISQDKRAAILNDRPEFWIDGQYIPDMAFQLRTPHKSEYLPPDRAWPDSLTADMDTTSREMYHIQIDSLQAPGYAIPPLAFSLNFYYFGKNFRVRNQLISLLAAPKTALAKLNAPTRTDAGYAAELEVLKELDARLSIFKPDGENIFTLDNKFSIGRHTVEIPRLVFRQPGKYYLFLNTDFGVAKLEVVLE